MIAELAPATGRREKVAEIIGNCRSNLHRMCLNEYRRQDLPVGSRIIGVGYKHVVVERLGKSDSPLLGRGCVRLDAAI